ncbi:SGNH/GDSL hydrolase family protein [Magnetospirillum sp. 15-1]|uniref:SGNH/GDSL hydrolase family protein n=1 Tax=Magnetospirillum sp. 15-1 TaxID=1979370 RepID=UPI000BBC9C04|nr:SGNH/GDSL hydrolase family protein [Magnetospirillum sp. 15-1]
MRRNRTNPFQRLFSTLGLLLLILAVGIGGLELVAGWAVKLIRDKRPAFAAQMSDADLGKLYNAEDVGRYRKILKEEWRQFDTVYTPFVEYRTAPYQGEHFTVSDDGVRGNGAGRPDLGAEGAKVFVFGGSTTLGAGVADDETIPAYVEQALGAAGRADVKVFNFGTVSYYSTQERIALERLLTAGIKPDVVVFVDGDADFYHCAVPDSSAWNERLSQITLARSRLPLWRDLAARSHVLQMIRHLAGDKSVLVREWGRFCDTDAEVDAVIRRLDANRRMIDAMAERLGFKVLFVQQPVPTYAYDNRKRPFPVKEEALGYHMNAARGYPRLAEMRAAGQLWDKGLLWLAELEPAGGNAYIDAVHYSPAFNKAIGERIATVLVEGGTLPAGNSR